MPSHPRGFRLFRLANLLVVTGALIFPGTSARVAASPPSSGQESVILLHGLARTRRSMAALAEALTAAGYHTVNLGYPSRTATVEALAMQTIPAALDLCSAAEATRIHFVTHSMGGLLVRYYLTRRAIENLGRVVMLAPPNQGSELCDALRENFFYRWYNGPAALQLGTGPNDLPARLGPVDYPVGVIAGNVHSFFDAWLSKRIPGEDDGKVSVERTKVAGMADFVVLPYTHPFIMGEDKTIGQTIHFLRHGVFRRLP